MGASHRMVPYEKKEKYPIKKAHGMIMSFFREILKNRALYIMALPAMAFLFAFNYMPLFGLLIAFKDYKFSQGIFGSAWMKPLLYNFQFLFDSTAAIRAIRNTIWLNVVFTFFAILIEVSFALLINELGGRWFKKITQSISFLPYFISWMVVGVFTYNFFNTDYGSVNSLLSTFGIKPVSWYSTPMAWPFILTLINRWKNTGYGSIMYLAILSGINVSYYEAAQIDGATRWQQIKYISLPLLRPTVTILTLLQLGRIMNADFGMFYATVGDASLLYSTTDVIDTFVYRSLRVTGDIGMASATGLVQSVLSFILVMVSNRIARKIDEDSSLF